MRQITNLVSGNWKQNELNKIKLFNEHHYNIFTVNYKEEKQIAHFTCGVKALECATNYNSIESNKNKKQEQILMSCFLSSC